MISPNLTKNILKVIAHGTEPFYACDLGLNGGEINGLNLNGYIEPTGNTRPVEITLPYWDVIKGRIEIKKTVAAKEWRYTPIKDKYNDPDMYSAEARDWLIGIYKKELDTMIAQAREIVALADALGL